MRLKLPSIDAIGVAATAFFLGGMFACVEGWVDGRWMALFIGLPFIVVVIPDILRCQGWRGLLSIPVLFVVFGVLMLSAALFGDWLTHNRWLNQHQWLEPIVVILGFCIIVKYVVSRR